MPADELINVRPLQDGISPTIDPDVLAFLRALADIEASPITAGTPDQARAANAEFLRQAGIEPVEIPHVEEIEIPTPDGRIPARRYRARARPAAVLVFFHGGGWVLGDLEGHDPLCRLLARVADLEVVNVDYRLAPEHRFPAGLHDAFAATTWSAETLADGRPLLVGGDSSGGNLAAAVALMARDERSPQIHLQLLLYPVLDHDLDTSSYRRFGDGHLLLRSDMEWFFQQYAPELARRCEPLVSPLRAATLAGVAPAYIATAGHDPLLDEARAFARRLAGAGVHVTERCFEGMIHGFLTMPRAIPSTRQVIDDVLGDIAGLVEDLAHPDDGLCVPPAEAITPSAPECRS